MFSCVVLWSSTAGGGEHERYLPQGRGVHHFLEGRGVSGLPARNNRIDG